MYVIIKIKIFSTIQASGIIFASAHNSDVQVHSDQLISDLKFFEINLLLFVSIKSQDIKLKCEIKKSSSLKNNNSYIS